MRHILIVDDSRAASERMAAVAAENGFTCATARSLREAHGQIALQKPDIAFVDLRLPDGSGMVLLEEGGLLEGTEDVVISTFTKQGNA